MFETESVDTEHEKRWGVAVVVIWPRRTGHQVLLLKRAHPPVGAWTYVTGRVEAGETQLDAASRELLEETSISGAHLAQAESIGALQPFVSDARWRSPVFVALADAEAQVILNSEHHEFRWTDPADALSLLEFSDHRFVLQSILSVTREVLSAMSG